MPKVVRVTKVRVLTDLSDENLPSGKFSPVHWLPYRCPGTKRLASSLVSRKYRESVPASSFQPILSGNPGLDDDWRPSVAARCVPGTLLEITNDDFDCNSLCMGALKAELMATTQRATPACM
eukprot:CAMPEP_0184657492 /NCGR_PEP_ID=MMETSP0308-20130426/20076_1 /TAXON_ID=38269 /ORGANISM="Gloeochaete witrockiana, Strain SAG 46.84" /LENGTH=121 /DNA_ID=CAMNT_0027095395 /DNA_START=131 /DNA_END=496 /DNA_ORIENTATION=+